MELEPCRNVIFNPFENISEELFDLIFQHLTGNEILTISEVSQQCDDIISDSKKCLDKITLVVKNKSMNSDLKTFQRVYRHLRVSDFYDSATQKWPKSAHESKLKTLKMIEFYDKFSTSLKSIEVKSNLLHDGEVPGRCPTELETLKIMLLNKFIANFFSSAPKLKCLQLGYTTLPEEELIKFIAQFDTIESFHLRFKVFERLFAEDISKKVTFKLKKLEVQKSYNGRTTCDENFETFLLSQEKSLEEVEFLNVVNADTINLVMDKCKIKKLTLNFIDEPLQLNPKPNKYLENFVMKGDQNCFLILRAAPALKNFHVNKICKKLIEYLACGMKNLRVVTYKETENDFSGTIQDFYQEFLVSCKEKLVNNIINFQKI